MKNYKNTLFENLSVLIVEDEKEIAEEISYFLSSNSADTFYADTGKIGLEMFKEYRPDIVLSDIRMSEMDGLSMIKILKKDFPDTPIILMSAHSDTDYLQEAIEIGVDSYLIKPVSLGTLRNRLMRIASTLTYQREVAAAHHLSAEYLKALETSVIFSKTDDQGVITYVNDAFIDICGYSREELIGHSHNIMRHPEMSDSVFTELWDTITNGQIWKGILKNRRKDGSAYTVESTITPILDKENKIIEYMALRSDITELKSHNLQLQDVARKNEELALSRSREMMERLLRDDNTKLPNVLALQNELKKRHEGALMLLDVSNFNILNKLHGFAYGDIVLEKIGEHLKRVIAPEMLLYKLSGDRFAILLDSYSEQSVEGLSLQIFAYFDSTEITVETIENVISFSIGIAKIETDRDVIIDAEFALDRSKRYGKRFFVIYHKENKVFEDERESIGWLHKTRDYIYRDQIVPWYQPIIDVKTGNVYKYESLARIVDGDTIIPPHQFLGAAARLGLLTSVTKSMINKTFSRFAGTDTRFSINITERDIMDGYLIEFIRLKVERFGINPSQVTFEVLENLTLSSDGEKITSTLALVKDYGCRLAIDDFGSENSNFGRILSLQSDYLKIDGMFIEGCDKEHEKRQIIDAIVQLAKRLEIKTVAEYVSSEAIFETIKELGVDYAQGFLFGKPMPLHK